MAGLFKNTSGFHSTYEINNPLEVSYSKNVEKVQEKASELARESGFYFEAQFYSQICKLLEVKKSDIEYGGNQIRGIAVFNKIGKSSSKEAQSLKEIIERGAEEAATAFGQQIKDLEEATGEKQVVTIINPHGDTALPPEVGDFIIKLGEKKYIFELKAQEKPETETRWFALTEEKLFGPKNNFKDFLKRDGNRELYWSNTLITQKWARTLETVALTNFLKAKFFDNVSMEIEYFLKKGKSYKHSDYEEKVVVHTNSIGFSFTNLSTVITSMQNAATGMRGHKRSFSSTNVLTYLDSENNEIGHFGLDQYDSIAKRAYRNKANPEKNRPSTIRTKVKDLGQEHFHFEFYVAQKFFNGLIR